MEEGRGCCCCACLGSRGWGAASAAACAEKKKGDGAAAARAEEEGDWARLLLVLGKRGWALLPSTRDHRTPLAAPPPWRSTTPLPPLPTSSVGHTAMGRAVVLKQMGYDSAAAGADPLGIEICRSRAGLGAEPPVSVAPLPQPKTQEDAQKERKRDKKMVVELRARKFTRWRAQRVLWDYRNAEAALAQLENQEVEPAAPDGEEKENERR